MAQNITLMGASYQAVPSVTLPKTGGGTASFTDVTDTTATTADVAQGKYFHLATGERVAGTASGGGGDTYTLTTVVPQQTFTADSSTYDADVTMASEFVFGDSYVITLDGTEYVSSCGSLWSGQTYLGDSAMLWYDGGGAVSYSCPFSVANEAWVGLTATVKVPAGSHTIKVEHLELGGGSA